MLWLTLFDQSEPRLVAHPWKKAYQAAGHEFRVTTRPLEHLIEKFAREGDIDIEEMTGADLLTSGELLEREVDRLHQEMRLALHETKACKAEMNRMQRELRSDLFKIQNAMRHRLADVIQSGEDKMTQRLQKLVRALGKAVQVEHIRSTLG